MGKLCFKTMFADMVLKHGFASRSFRPPPTPYGRVHCKMAGMGWDADWQVPANDMHKPDVLPYGKYDFQAQPTAYCNRLV